MVAFLDVFTDQFAGRSDLCHPWLVVTECGFAIARGYRAVKKRSASVRTLRDELLIGGVQRIHPKTAREAPGFNCGEDSKSKEWPPWPCADTRKD